MITAYELARLFHETYEEKARSTGWNTNAKCKVKFDDLPESNKQTMILTCETILNKLTTSDIIKERTQLKHLLERMRELKNEGDC